MTLAKIFGSCRKNQDINKTDSHSKELLELQDWFVNKMLGSRPARRAEAIERWTNNNELQHSLRLTAKENKAQEPKS
jgi:vacuolar-type H+-ATPase catalytic subunit A/Vma1